VVFKNKIWVIGDDDKSDVWSSADGAKWSKGPATDFLSTFRFGRTHHQSVEFDNKMWVIGGGTGTNNANDVWSSTCGTTWTEAKLTTAFPDRYEHESVVFDNKIWVIGGTDGSNKFNDVWSSADGKDWTEVTDNTGFSAFSGHQVVVFDNKMWLIGGVEVIPSTHNNTSKALNEVWNSADGITWTKVDTATPIFSARSDHQSVVFDNKMWVIGGSTVGLPNLANDVWSSVDGITWIKEIATTATATFVPRSLHRSVVFDNKIWVISGDDDIDSPLSNDVWSSADGKDWTKVTIMPTFSARFFSEAVVFDNKIWIITGQTADEENDVWSLSKK
jgi:dihydrofolate reductase